MLPSSGTLPLLSIAIPTRNREEYALSSVASILAINSNDLEVVVQDNSDASDLEDSLRKYTSDLRLRYAHCPTPLSFVGNFNAALELCRGQYVCLIGDDDGVNPEIIEAARWARERGVDALTPSLPASYLWPHSGVGSTLFTRIPQGTGSLAIRTFSGRVIDVVPGVELLKVVRNGGQGFLLTRIPRLYHGIVSKTCLEKIRLRTGSYFGGLSPDIFAAVGVANFAVTAKFVDYPLTLPGACRLSGSIQSLVGGHTGRFEDAPHLRFRGAYQWSSLVPRYYSVPTIWADSTLAALKSLGREDLLTEFSVARLAAQCLSENPSYARLIITDFFRAVHSLGGNSFSATGQLLKALWGGPARSFLRRLENRVQILLKGRRLEMLSGLANIGEATNALGTFLKESGWAFSTCIQTARRSH